MAHTVLFGDPTYFRIKSGSNPHTRDRWGRRKKVDQEKAMAQWILLKKTLEGQGVRVLVLPPVEDQPGTVFPANAGFRWGNSVYLSHLNPGRKGETDHYRRIVTSHGFSAVDLVSSYPFEGEADFIPVGDPSGDPGKTVYLFTYGRVRRQRWAPQLQFPFYRRVYGFRSDRRILPVLQQIVGDREIIPLELVNEAHYHGDTVICSFGPHREQLLVYREALAPNAQAILDNRFGDRLVPLSESDGRAFAANSFQIQAVSSTESAFILIMPDGLTQALYEAVDALGVIPCPVDVSEFLEKGGGAVKCMLLDLGEW